MSSTKPAASTHPGEVVCELRARGEVQAALGARAAPRVGRARAAALLVVLFLAHDAAFTGSLNDRKSFSIF